MTSDPTRQRNQPALTTSTGRSWLILGGLLAAISLAVLIPMLDFAPHGVALAAVVAIAVLYVGMVVVRFTMARGRLRLALMAAGMIAIAVVALGAVLAVAWVAT